MPIKYHLYRNPLAYTEPTNTTLRCLRCGGEREGVPTAEELSNDPCSAVKRWVLGCWNSEAAGNERLKQDHARRRSIVLAVKGGCLTFNAIVKELEVPDRAHFKVKEWLDELLFLGLLAFDSNLGLLTPDSMRRLEVTKLGEWQTGERYRAGPQPSIYLAGEQAALNRARNRRSNDLRAYNCPPGTPKGDLSTYERLKLLLLDLKVPTNRIDAIADAVTAKFSLRLKRGK